MFLCNRVVEEIINLFSTYFNWPTNQRSNKEKQSILIVK